METNTNPKAATLLRISDLLSKEFDRRPLIDIRDLYSYWNNNTNGRKDEMVFSLLQNTPQIIYQLHTESTTFGKILFGQNHYDKLKRDPIIKSVLDGLTRPAQNPFLIEPPSFLQNSIENSMKCICNQLVEVYSPHIKCTAAKCGRLMHRTCMKLNPTEDYPLFECPQCVLWKCDPLHQVIKPLIPPFLIDNTRKEFSINEEMFKMIKGKTNYCVEVRSIRLEDKNHEQCWPNSGELILNQQKQAEFKPLQQNSSLKKRKDEKFFTKEVHLGNNYLYLKMMKKETYLAKKIEETYVAAVFLVKKLTCEELIQNIKQSSRRSMEDCQRMISLDFQSSPLDINMVRHPLTCVFDMQLLKTPAKGAHCKHINCFSLENFVSVWQKNGQRKWTCPVCKLKSYDIIIDTYFEKIMNEVRAGSFEDPTSINVEIYRDATYRFIKDDSEDEMENDDNSVAKQDKAPEKPNNLVILDESDEEEPPKPTQPAQNNSQNHNLPSLPPTLEMLQHHQKGIMQIEIGTPEAKSQRRDKTPPSSSMKSLIEIESPQQIAHLKAQLNNNPFSSPLEHRFHAQMPANYHHSPPLTQANNNIQIPPLLQPVSTQPNFNWPSSYYKQAQQTPPGKSLKPNMNSPHVFQPFLNQKASEVYPETAQALQPLQNFVPIQPFPVNGIPAFLQNQENVSSEIKKMMNQLQQQKSQSQSQSHHSQEQMILNAQIGHTRPITSTIESQEPPSSSSREHIKRSSNPTIKAQAEETIQKLSELSDKKLELPHFRDFKTKKFADLAVNKDLSLQRSKKLLSTMSKHISVYPTRAPRSLKQPPMEIENKEAPLFSHKELNIEKSQDSSVPSSEQNMIKTNVQTELPTQFTANPIPKWVGNEDNPICLDD